MLLRSFQHYRDTTHEVGFVERFSSTLVQVRGLPGIHTGEVVLFESGALGQVVAFGEALATVLVLTTEGFTVGESVVRTGEELSIRVGTALLGGSIDPLGRRLDGGGGISDSRDHKSYMRNEGAEGETREHSGSETQIGSKNMGFTPGVKNPPNIPSILKAAETRLIDQTPVGISKRKAIKEPLETGVTLVDFLVPLARGQRELVIGDRRSGKSRFVLAALKAQVEHGSVGVYAAIGKRAADIKRVEFYLREHKLDSRVVVVATDSADPSGLIFLTPYTAMTVAEYFRDQGEHVVVVLDDLTTHAKFHREVMLLAGRFPGRSSYAGDVFHAQARIVERAGVFEDGTITLLPVAETVGGNLTGYIQTNLMAMTDGHLFFDIELFDRGKRPAINPFLSVTRVGLGPQASIFKSLQRELMQLLVKLKKIEEFVHFGGETGVHVQNLTALGERLRLIIEESTLAEGREIPKQLKAYLLALLWANVWKDLTEEKVVEAMTTVAGSFVKNKAVRDHVSKLLNASQTFAQVVEAVAAETLLRSGQQQGVGG